MIDVIMLSLTINDELYAITQNAINSLHESETHHKFNVVLIESNTNSSHSYKNCNCIKLDLPFNYNRYMNYGLSITNNEYVALCNNDLIFHKEWFSEIYKYTDIAESFSPWNGYANWHSSKFQDTRPYIEGYRTSYEIAGWCIVLKRKILDYIKLDERVDFWYSDNIYADELIKHKYKHILVRNSLVDHLCSKTPLGDKHQDLTINQIKKYKG